MRRAAAVVLLLLTAPAWAGPKVEIDPDNPGPGEVFAVRVPELAGGGPYEASFDHVRFPLWPADGAWEGLAAVDRDAGTGSRELRIHGPAGGEPPLAVRAVTVEARTYPEQRLTVPESQVTLSPEDQARAAREGSQIREVLAARTARRLWAGAFRFPAEGPVSSPFGVRRFFNDQPRGYHSGLDIAAPRGAPVLAGAAGVVTLVGDFFYTGNTVFLDHGLGLFTGHFHLDSVAVVEGQAVPAGALLGRVGSTGRSTGPHLHWGVYVAGVRVDPASLVRVSGGEAVGGEGP